MATQGQLRGAFLEYIIRYILVKCGFKDVVDDDKYIYKRGGLKYINGKGASHDADVLMTPPIQMPFGFPTRLLFECKAYSEDIGLNVLRSAFGLREDINNFDIITDEMIESRKNNRRRTLAVEILDRYFYQVGVVSYKDFSNPAVEYAILNKIPLLSLTTFFNSNDVTNINHFFGSLDRKIVLRLYRVFKETNFDSLSGLRETYDFLDGIFSIIDKGFIAVNELGDYFVLKLNQSNINLNQFDNNFFKLRWGDQNRNLWSIEINNEYPFSFYLPELIVDRWGRYGDINRGARRIKGERFGKLYIFVGDRLDINKSYITLNMDYGWLDSLD